jgi:hypothetical protein
MLTKMLITFDKDLKKWLLKIGGTPYVFYILQTEAVLPVQIVLKKHSKNYITTKIIS